MPKKTAAPSINHIIVGFSFPSEQNPQEVITGTTRHSIWLSMSSQLYARMVTAAAAANGASKLAKAEAEALVNLSFELTDIYLKKLDSEVARFASLTSKDRNSA
jgi:hypothetical protein